MARNKWWKKQTWHSDTQYESKLHPNFLYLTVYKGARTVVVRLGNSYFNLTGCPSEAIYIGKDEKDAKEWLRKFVKRNSGKDYLHKTRERFKTKFESKSK